MTGDTLSTRIQAKIVISETGCHVWQGTRNRSGYGQIWVKDRLRLAHRIVWSMAHGPIPDGFYVMHTCDNPPCVNLEHLVLGTAADNSHDMVQKGRSILGRRMAHRKYDPEKPSTTEQYAVEGRAYTGDSAKKLHVKQYAREYQKRRYANDPDYREKKKAAAKRWRKQNHKRHREWLRASEQRKRDVLEPGWREKRYERILRQRENAKYTEEHVAFRANIYTFAEIARMAGVSRSTVTRWADSGKLATVQHGKTTAVRKDAWDAFAESLAASYGVREVAQLLGVHYDVVRSWIAKDKLPAVRLGNGYRISFESLAQLMVLPRNGRGPVIPPSGI